MEEKRESQPIEHEDSMEVDNNYQDQRKESKTFGETGLGPKRRCAVCHTPLTAYNFHGFNVLYCEKDAKPVCRICRYPSIELIGTDAIHCTHEKCPTYRQSISKSKGDRRGDESA